jgi:signal transduction histidine kinase
MPLSRTNLPTRTPPPRGGAFTSNDSTNPDGPAGLDSPTTLTTPADRLQTELESVAERIDQLHAQLRQAQKLASLGATAAVIAHEFNNLFTPIVAYARHALDTDDVPLMKRALEKTLTQVEIMRNMSDRVIGLAKQGDSGLKAVNVAAVVSNAIECLCRDLNKDNITVQTQIDPALTVRANESSLLQVLFNLVINARQAMLGRRGRLTVDAAAQDGRVRISVRDTGCGIPPENLDRIFEPFFSTKTNADKPDRRGLGLGLSICRDMIEELDGTIRVTSEVNVGTTFTLDLPEA